MGYKVENDRFSKTHMEAAAKEKRIKDPQLRSADCKSALAAMNYIVVNPEELAKAELVANPEDYLYSSARDYAGEKGLVTIELV